jgi:hypothetical protein
MIFLGGRVKRIFCSVVSLFSLLLVLALGCQSSPKDAASANGSSGQPAWTANMVQLREALLRIEPYLVDEKKFGSEENEQLLKKEIGQLAELTKNVTHNPTLVSRDPTVRFVASQFSQDIQRSVESFDQGKKEFSRYQLMKVTGYCIECHTRTQQGPQYDGPAQNKNLQSLSRFQKAEYLISARYFDEALKLLEEEVVSPNAGVGFSRMERSAKYGLMITVQYQQNPNRALEFVKKIETSKTAPFALVEKAKTWEKALRSWKNEKTKPGASQGIEAYRKLAMKKGSDVDQMRALAGLLPRLATDLKPDELGESLYLVGICYEGLSDLSLFSLHENYYESCVRSVSHTPWAKKCYDKLEESIRFGYSGSGGTHIPVEVQLYLDSLKKSLD